MHTFNYRIAMKSFILINIFFHFNYKMVIVNPTIDPIQRFQEIKDEPFHSEAVELINLYSRNGHDPNFRDWLFDQYLLNLEISEYLILVDD